MSQLRVFLDTTVLASYFTGRREARGLFDSEVTKRVKYFISPLVLQELLLVADGVNKNDRGGELRKLVSKYLTIRELDKDTVRASGEYIRRWKNKRVHANDLLNIQVASTTADYFLTLDEDLLSLRRVDSVEVISPREFFEILKQAA